jgi:uracil-DNA glycosylase
MSKKEKLEELKKRMEEDKDLPLRKGATQLVFGEGDPDSKIYFLGEAPGFHEDRQGRPFVGMAGKLLNELIESIGLKREDVYISNIVRFRPPENRDPEPQEIAAFAPFIDEEISIIDPEVIVTLGRFSMNKFLPEARITRVHGQVFKINFLGKERVVIPMFHPAAALRRDEIRVEIKKDFKVIEKVLKTPEKPKDAQSSTEKASNDDKEAKPHQLELI